MRYVFLSGCLSFVVLLRQELLLFTMCVTLTAILPVSLQSTTRVKPFICTMPMRLDEGWNQIQFNLSDFTRRAYGTNYIETLRVQVCRDYNSLLLFCLLHAGRGVLCPPLAFPVCMFVCHAALCLRCGARVCEHSCIVLCVLLDFRNIRSGLFLLCAAPGLTPVCLPASQLHANCRIRRIYFSDRLYSEEELPAEFKLFLPIQKQAAAAATAAT